MILNCEGTWPSQHRNITLIYNLINNLLKMFLYQAQEAFIASLDDEVRATFNGGDPAELTELHQNWDKYLKDMSKFEHILPNLIQVHNLYAYIYFAEI